MKEWISNKKNLCGLIALVLSLLTLIALCFNAVSVKSPYVTEGYTGFNLMSFDETYKIIVESATAYGVLSIFVLLFSIFGLICSAICLFIKNETRAKKLETVVVIICLIGLLIFMIVGICASSDVKSQLNSSYKKYVKTAAYIPFILGVIFAVLYFVLPKILGNKLDGVTSTTTGQTKIMSSGNIKNEASKLELLRQYKTAFDDGLITEEEYYEKKKELM